MSFGLRRQPGPQWSETCARGTIPNNTRLSSGASNQGALCSTYSAKYRILRSRGVRDDVLPRKRTTAAVSILNHWRCQIAPNHTPVFAAAVDISTRTPDCIHAPQDEKVEQLRGREQRNSPSTPLPKEDETDATRDLVLPAFGWA